MKIMKAILALPFVILILTLSSCSLDPVIADQGSTEIEDISDLRTLMDGSYNVMVNYRYWGRNMILAGEVRSDNTFSNGKSNRYPNWSKMDLNDRNERVENLFNYAYASVANSNVIINDPDLDSKISQQYIADKNHILGEAYSIRALAHFDLLRTFGQTYLNEGEDLGIPYMTEFKGGQGNNIARNTVTENQSQIYKDIADAITAFKQASSSQYNGDKTRMSLDATYALQSRVGIYFKDYDYAFEGSKEIVDKYSVTAAQDYVNYWANPAPGAASIFELEQNATDNQGQNNIGYIYRGIKLGDIEVFKTLYDDANFDTNDVRFSPAMIRENSGRLRNMGKYPADDESGHDNIKVFRIAEVVLNHAEALYLKSSPQAAEALSYLNKIPKNRDALTYANITIENILEERRKELLFEGFRLYDLARYQLDIKDMDPSTVNNHGHVEAGSYRLALPIPRHEMDSNKEMKQNPGY